MSTTQLITPNSLNQISIKIKGKNWPSTICTKEPFCLYTTLKEEGGESYSAAASNTV